MIAGGQLSMEPLPRAATQEGSMTTRKVQDNKLDSRSSREKKLKARGMPYYRKIESGLAVGYRKLRGQAGTWWCRHYIGEGKYDVERLGTADDLTDAFANGATDNHTLKLLEAVADPVLTFDQAQAQARARKGKRATGVTGPLTVADVMDQYLERLEGEGSKSVDDARYRAKAFIYPRLGSIEVKALTADILHKWKARLAKEAPRLRTKKGKAQKHRSVVGDEAEAVRRRQATANRVLTILKAALNQAWRDEKTSSDKAWRSVQPFESVDVARIRYLTVAEAKRLINASDTEFRSLVEAALATGARYGELVRLTVADFHVHVTERDKIGKPAKVEMGTIAIRQSKSGKARHVVLTEEGIALFRQLSAGRVGSDLMIRKPNGSAWEKSNQARPMKEACTRAKIMPPINFHGLRHTYASHAVMNGVPLLVVAKNLGHSDTRMVEKHYGHLAPSYIADAIREGAPRFGFKATANVRQFGSST
jgi:integrase